MWLRLVTFALTLPALGQAQNSLTGLIVSRETGERLGYSIVELPSRKLERFATDSGLFYFGELPLGALPIRIRRLGFTPVDTVVSIGPGQPDTLRIALTRIAVQLERITVSAHPPCEKPGPPSATVDSALHVLFTQIRLNAEQYRFLANEYPFTYAVEVTRSTRLRIGGSVRIDGTGVQHLDAKSAWSYKPGRVVQRRGRNYYFAIPTLVDFADRNFLNQHCFHYGGTENLDDGRVVRVDFVASWRIKEPDVNGTIYVDPETFQVRRTVLRLTQPPRAFDMREFTITTHFQEIMPSISIISHVQSVQALAATASTDFDTAYEEQRLIGFQFLRKKPGDDSRKDP